MSLSPGILAFAGSTRKESFNKKLVQIAVHGAREAPLAAFQGKVARLLSASPGALGGLRGLVHLRAVLGNIGVIVLPDQIAVSKAHEAFDGGGSLKDSKQQASVQSLGRTLAETVRRLNS